MSILYTVEENFINSKRFIIATIHHLPLYLECLKSFHSASSLSRPSSSRNWEVMDQSDPTNNYYKYYINVCRPITAVIGCDRLASACQKKYEVQQVRFGEIHLSCCIRHVSSHFILHSLSIGVLESFHGVYSSCAPIPPSIHLAYTRYTHAVHFSKRV